MKKCFLTFLIIFFLGLLYSWGQTNNNYSKSLKSSVDMLIANKKLTDEKILSLIPTTEDNFIEYYSYTNPDKGKEINKVFYQIDNLIRDRAAENKTGFLKRYLELAVFADGEYAESYVDDSDFVIGKNITEFCRLYPSLSNRAKELFKDQKNKYCK